MDMSNLFRILECSGNVCLHVGVSALVHLDAVLELPVEGELGVKLAVTKNLVTEGVR